MLKGCRARCVSRCRLVKGSACLVFTSRDEGAGFSLISVSSYRVVDIVKCTHSFRLIHFLLRFGVNARVNVSHRIVNCVLRPSRWSWKDPDERGRHPRDAENSTLIRNLTTALAEDCPS